jgi:hypothetical protein
MCLDIERPREIETLNCRSLVHYCGLSDIPRECRVSREPKERGPVPELSVGKPGPGIREIPGRTIIIKVPGHSDCFRARLGRVLTTA